MPIALLTALRWAARGSSLVLALGYVALVLGHLVQPDSGPPTQIREWVGIILLSTACLAGLFAWRRELPGAVLSLVALALFVAVIRINQPLVIAVIATPGVLFVLTSLGLDILPLKPNRPPHRQ